MASRHGGSARLLDRHGLFCARLEARKGVGRATPWWLSWRLGKLVEGNADSSEMASSGMVAFLGGRPWDTRPWDTHPGRKRLLQRQLRLGTTTTHLP